MVRPTYHYIRRTLKIDQQSLTEDELLRGAKITIVLAEPGAGKTALLDNLADSLSTERIRASLFLHKTKFKNAKTLIIDGLDEVAKIDLSAIDAIIMKAAELGPEKVIFASRAAQWEQARTKTIESAFGEAPRVAYLFELSEVEQRELFSSYKPQENFEAFKSSLDILNLSGLLGNPQMLKIFADAYVRNGGKFSTKDQVFKEAIEQLASENNEDHSQKDRPPSATIALEGDEIFCKTLLSGSTGIATTESASDSSFPYVRSILASGSKSDAYAPLTGLFKPSEAPDQHEPVHRIIAEYSAARYLVRRIQDQSDRLTLKRILSVLAPNNVPRTELRGLISWMATQGNDEVAKAIIAIDPYAVISDGDPSLLSAASKTRLLEALVDYAKIDPYFRGSEGWRTFSVNGFFTPDIIETTKELLADNTINPNLRELILELIKNSPATSSLRVEILSLALDAGSKEGIRVRALEALQELNDFDWISTFDGLVAENSSLSLKLAASLIIHYGVENLDANKLLYTIKSLIAAYYPSPTKSGRRRSTKIGAKYFITRLIRLLDRPTTIFLLDSLSKSLSCVCAPKRQYECHCRDGKSKMIGRLMDNLFKDGDELPTAEQIYAWTKNLKFQNSGGVSDSASVEALHNSDDLRQAVQRLIFGRLTDPQTIQDTQFDLHMNYGHAGVSFRNGDFRAISDFAFETDNVALWEKFIAQHRFYEKKSFENPHRTHMRKQALNKAEFGKVWAKHNRASKESYIKDGFKSSYSAKKHRKRRTAIKTDNQQHFDDNIELISQGRHFGWLRVFAEGYLASDLRHFPEMVDSDLPANALLNCFDFIEPDLPSLTEISKSNGTYHTVIVAHAACLVHFRKFGHLNGISREILTAVKTEAMLNNADDSNAFNAEINKQIFGNPQDAEDFIRTMVEPQLEDSSRQHTNVGWLEYQPEFSHLQESLAIEWLKRFSEMHLQPTNTLFKLAAEKNHVSRLKALIESQVQRLSKPPFDPQKIEEFEQARDYWNLRKFFFFDKCDDATISWLKENKERLLEINSIVGRVHNDDGANWKTLTPQKVGMILDIFVNKWPKVTLPNSWGTGDPPEQTAYRFLSDLCWRIDKGDADEALAVIEALLSDDRFLDFTNALKSKKVDVLKALALKNFSPPSPQTLVHMLDNQQIASVEDMRALLLELMEQIQSWISGAETNPETYFYDKQKNGDLVRVDENRATKVIVDKLQSKCEALGLSVTIEHHLHDDKRSDFTLRTNIQGTEYLLVTEVKGQWHKELYTAAATQLSERYMGHPNAADQGVYIALWFGSEYPVAKKSHEVTSAAELKAKIEANMPEELRSKVDVFVLDVSK